MYQIKLPVFEGPFDLLLYLIRKNEIDIYDIPIAQITREYLEYIELMKMLDLEVAGEFIEMVATLILIKARMLLPNPEAEDLEEMEDPRRKLTLQLLEYKRFKEVAGELETLESERRQYFPRASAERKRVLKSLPEEEEFTIDATLFDLLSAFKTALDNMPKITVHKVKSIKVKLEDQVRHIVDCFEGKNYLLFSEVVREMSEKIYIIVTFMAVLDMMKLGMITTKQSDIFGEVRLVPLTEITMSRYLSMREALEVGPEGAVEAQ